MSKTEIFETLKSLDSNLKKLQYSFLELDDLLESSATKEVKRISKLLLNSVVESHMASSKVEGKPLADIKWASDYLSHIPRHLKTANGTQDIAVAIDYIVVNIRNVGSLGQYLRTRTYDGSKERTIVTNLLSIRGGDHLAIACVPPVVVGGEVSEGMFIGPKKWEEEVGTLLDWKNLPISESRSILFQFLKSHR